MEEFLKKENFKSYDFIETDCTNGGTDPSTLTNNSSMRVTIPDKDSIFLPYDSYLHIRGQIVQSATAQDAIVKGKIALVNSGWSLFYDATYKQNNVVIEQFINPGRVHQAHGLINYSDDYARGQGKEQLWSPDKGPDGRIPSIQAFTVWRNGALTDHTLSFPDTIDSLLTLSDAGTAGQSITLYFEGHEVKVLRTTAAGVSSFVDLVTTATDTTNITYVGIVATDTVRFFANGYELILVNANVADQGITTTWDSPLGISAIAGATNVSIAVNNGAAFGSVGAVRATYASNVDVNSGYEERRLRGCQSMSNITNRAIELWMPLREIFKYFQEQPMPISGATQEINFTKAQPSNYFFADTVCTGTYASPIFKYLKFSWWMPSVEYKLEISTKYLSMLNNKSLPISWHGYQYEDKGGLSSQSGSQRLATISSRPKRAFIWFMKDSRDDSLNQNNRIMDNYDMRSIYLKINTTKFPQYSMEIDFGLETTATIGEAGDDYMRAYNAYLTACGNIQHSWDCTPAISYEEFKNIYTIYCFDVYDKTENLFRANQSLDVFVVYQMRSSPSENYKICMVLDPEKEIVMDYKEGKIVKLISSDTV